MKATRAFLIFNLLNDMGTVITSSPNVLELLDEDDGINKVRYLMISELGTKELESRIKHELMDIDDVKVFKYIIENSNEKNVVGKDIESIDQIKQEPTKREVNSEKNEKKYRRL